MATIDSSIDGSLTIMVLDKQEVEALARQIGKIREDEDDYGILYEIYECL